MPVGLGRGSPSALGWWGGGRVAPRCCCVMGLGEHWGQLLGFLHLQPLAVPSAQLSPPWGSLLWVPAALGLEMLAEEERQSYGTGSSNPPDLGPDGGS